MFDHQTFDRSQEGRGPNEGRLRSGRVRLSWLSWETLGFLAAAAVVMLVLSARLDVEDEPAARAQTTTVGGHEILLEALALDPNRPVLISSGWDDTVRFWDVDPSRPTWGEEVLSLPQESRPYAVAPSSDGRYLAVGGAGHLTLWEKQGDGWSSRLIKEGTDHRYLAFAPDSQTLVIGGEGGDLRILSVPSLEETRLLKGLGDMVHAVAFSPDGSLVAASSFGGRLAVWDVKTGELLSLGAKVGRVHAFAFSPDSRSLAVATWIPSGGDVDVWNVSTGERRTRLRCGLGVNALAYSPDGGMLAVGGMDQTIRVWDVQSWELRGTPAQNVGWVKTLLFTQGGSRLAYGGRDGSIRFLDVPSALPERRAEAVSPRRKPTEG